MQRSGGMMRTLCAWITYGNEAAGISRKYHAETPLDGAPKGVVDAKADCIGKTGHIVPVARRTQTAFIQAENVEMHRR